MSASRPNKRKAIEQLTDPRAPGGGYAGPGGPLDHGGVVVDMTKAVLLDQVGALIVHVERGGVKEKAVGITLEGRINQTTDRTSILYLTDLDGAVSVVVEVLGLMDRAGLGPQFAAEVGAKLADLEEAIRRAE